MKEGDIVAVFGELDNRVREKAKDKLIVGTLYYFLTENRVCVIIEHNGYEFWIGDRKYIGPIGEQI